MAVSVSDLSFVVSLYCLMDEGRFEGSFDSLENLSNIEK